MGGDFLAEAKFFAAALTLFAYLFGVFLKNRFRLAIFNPILIAVVFLMSALLLCGIPYARYAEGAAEISYFLTPSTVCLAIPLYQQMSTLKQNVRPILAAISAGVLVNFLAIYFFAVAFDWNFAEFATYFPKSITTALAIGLSEQMGGVVALTIASVIITGLVGNILSEPLMRIFGISHPIARGLAIGTSAHVIGTVKAVELGAVEGAMSSLAIVVTGVVTIALSIVIAAVLGIS